jgi:hypothetical protein
LYQEKEEHEVGAYTWCPEPISKDIGVMSLQIYDTEMSEPEINDMSQPKGRNKEEKVVDFDVTTDESSSEKHEGQPKRKDKTKQNNGEKKRYRVAEWRDEMVKEQKGERYYGEKWEKS